MGLWDFKTSSRTIEQLRLLSRNLGNFLSCFLVANWFVGFLPILSVSWRIWCERPSTQARPLWPPPWTGKSTRTCFDINSHGCWLVLSAHGLVKTLGITSTPESCDWKSLLRHKIKTFQTFVIDEHTRFFHLDNGHDANLIIPHHLTIFVILIPLNTSWWALNFLAYYFSKYAMFSTLTFLVTSRGFRFDNCC